MADPNDRIDEFAHALCVKQVADEQDDGTVVGSPTPSCLILGDGLGA